MCIGEPLRVIEAWPDGALVGGANGPEVIDTRLVGDCSAGEWLLVFRGAARERLSAERAREIAAALDLLACALAGDAEGAHADAGFALPSAMSAAQLAALAGTTTDPIAGVPSAGSAGMAEAVSPSPSRTDGERP